MKFEVNVSLKMVKMPPSLTAYYAYSNEQHYGEGYVVLVTKGVDTSMKRFKREASSWINNQNKVKERVEKSVVDNILTTVDQTDEEIFMELERMVEDKGFIFDMEIEDI